MKNRERAAYFDNHARRDRFPWSLYHGELSRKIGDVVRSHGRARVLVVGCGLEPEIEGAPLAECFGCDLDAAAIEACGSLYPHLAGRLAVSPGPYELPREGAFEAPFDVVVAKEVIEHVASPPDFAKALSSRVAVGGELLLTTPNYGRLSTLPLIERTVLEWIARRDGYSRRHIHPSRLDRHKLAALDVGPLLDLVDVAKTRTGWALFGQWKRIR